eukprot:348503-Pelagomonas_calceolata.AAC.6
MYAPVSASHIHIVISSDPASSTLPLGCQRTHSMAPSGPSSVLTGKEQCLGCPSGCVIQRYRQCSGGEGAVLELPEKLRARALSQLPCHVKKWGRPTIHAAHHHVGGWAIDSNAGHRVSVTFQYTCA